MIMFRAEWSGAKKVREFMCKLNDMQVDNLAIQKNNFDKNLQFHEFKPVF